MNRLNAFSAVIAALSLAGCASSTINYAPPTALSTEPNVRIINTNIDDIWAKSIPALGKNFFTINNLDKASGLINVSYSGDPSKFVDCGTIDATFENIRGKNAYHFLAAAPDVVYMQYSSPLALNIHRRLNLEGKMNIVFEAEGKTSTKVTANVRYILQRDIDVIASNGLTRQGHDTIAFNSNGRGSFPTGGNPSTTTECIATGELEREILDLIQ